MSELTRAVMDPAPELPGCWQSLSPSLDLEMGDLPPPVRKDAGERQGRCGGGGSWCCIWRWRAVVFGGGVAWLGTGGGCGEGGRGRR